MIAPRFVGTDHRGRSCPNSPEQWGDPDLAQKYLWKGCYGPHRVVSRRHAKEGGHRGDRPQTLYARSGEGGEAQRRRYVGVTFPDTHRSAHKAGSQAGSLLIGSGESAQTIARTALALVNALPQCPQHMPRLAHCQAGGGVACELCAQGVDERRVEIELTDLSEWRYAAAYMEALVRGALRTWDGDRAHWANKALVFTDSRERDHIDNAALHFQKLIGACRHPQSAMAMADYLVRGRTARRLPW